MELNKDFNRKIFFRASDHSYRDDLSNKYISTTTQIAHYTPKFESIEIAKVCAAIGKNPRHPKYGKYKGKSYKQILKEWNDTKEEACERGNIKHDFFENAIKNSNGYNKTKASVIFRNDRIYTIEDILENPSYGRLDIQDFIDSGLPNRFPDIYKYILQFHEKGYYFYSEICTYNYKYLKSGLIDLLAIKHSKKFFFILDWKTNKDDLHWESGYYEKDNEGNNLYWLANNNKLDYPLDHLAASKLNGYSLQLSDYANMTERFGLEHKGSLLFHIREEVKDEKTKNEYVNVLKIPYMKQEVQSMAEHYYRNKIREKRVVQTSLFSN